jgi:hypothetical protein
VNPRLRQAGVLSVVIEKQLAIGSLKTKTEDLFSLTQFRFPDSSAIFINVLTSLFKSSFL